SYALALPAERVGTSRLIGWIPACSSVAPAPRQQHPEHFLGYVAPGFPPDEDRGQCSDADQQQVEHPCKSGRDRAGDIRQQRGKSHYSSVKR
ncbi:MAG: hypothetical protein ACRDTT_33535, partial [Pseudonocardiaceae bacterium]